MEHTTTPKSVALSKSAPTPVAKSITHEVKAIAEQDSALADLVRLCAILGLQPIPEEILTKGAGELGYLLGPKVVNPVTFTSVLNEAAQRSLLIRNLEQKTLELAPLVHQAMTRRMDTPTQRLWAERAVRALSHAFPTSESATWQQGERFLPHIHALRH